HDVISGIDLGAHKAEWSDGEFEKVIGRDYFDASDEPLLTVLNKNNDAISILGVRNTRLVKAHGVSRQYGADDPSTWDAIFSYRQGATLNIKRLGNIFSPFEVSDCGPNDVCDLKYTFTNSFCFNNKTIRHIRYPGSANYSFDSNPSELIITKGSVKTPISFGTAAKGYQGFFMEPSFQVVLITGRFLQIWRLPSAASPLFELVHVEAFVEVTKARTKDSFITEALSVQSCKHGRRFSVVLKSVKQIGPKGEEVKDDLNSKEPMLTFPRSAGDTFTTNEKYRYENGIVSLLDTYADSDQCIKDAIIRFLVDRIHPSPKYSSSLVILCRSWKYTHRELFVDVIAKLLTEDRITWIPDIDATKREDPLSILTKFAKKDRSVHATACKIVIDYCIAHAIISNNLTLLAPFLRNLKNIVALFPDDAQVYLRKIAYIPVSDGLRDRIVDNSIVSHPPWHCIQFWKTPFGMKNQVMRYHATKEQWRDDATWREYIIERIIVFSRWQAKTFKKTTLSLDKIKDLAQLHVSVGRLHNKVDTLNQGLYVASFDALWHYKDITESKKKEPKDTTNTQEYTAKEQKLMDMVKEIEDTSIEVSETQRPIYNSTATGQEIVVKKVVETPWWKVPYYILKLKLHLQPHNYVTCHKFELEFFKNPAIAALVDYKW
ncbi:hypothetical protein BGZ70_001845, partial [Mortierella alpina]